jgi:hypothetical protein
VTITSNKFFTREIYSGINQHCKVFRIDHYEKIDTPKEVSDALRVSFTD